MKTLLLSGLAALAMTATALPAQAACVLVTDIATEEGDPRNAEDTPQSLTTESGGDSTVTITEDTSNGTRGRCTV